MVSDELDQQATAFEIPLPWQLVAWGRLAQQFKTEQLAHAYLVCGESGLGKTMFVSAFAHFMLCRTPHQQVACGECPNCLMGGKHSHPDIWQIGPEEGSKDIKIEQIRFLSEFAIRTSHSGGAKVVIITQAHRLNANAANALLKTLEEPPNNTYLFLVSDLAGRMLPTIRSRCQRLFFSAPSKSEASQWLQVKLGLEDIDKLLLASRNRPLLALELAATGALEHRQEFLAKLGELARGQSSIDKLVNLSGKIGEITALGYLAATSTILIKCMLTNQRPDETDQATDALCSIFDAKQLPVQALVADLFGFFEEVQTARRQLIAGTNPNPQLIMESLLWRWSMLQ